MFWTTKIEEDRYTEGSNWIFLNNCKDGTSITVPNNTLNRQQHLYIVSDDEIKEDDWVCDGGTIMRASSKLVNAQGLITRRDWKKIIATTDTSLEIVSKGINPLYEKLPHPSQQWIEYFVKKYNKGNIISGVLIEDDSKFTQTYHRSGRDFGGNEEYKYIETLKINPDNTITIKSLKESWNREETIKFAENYAKMVQDKKIINGHKAIHNRQWIEENL